MKKRKNASLSGCKKPIIQWLDSVPEDWGVVRLGSVTTENKVKNTGLKNRNLLSLSYGRIVRKDIKTTTGLVPESYETYQIVDPGTIVLRLTDLQNDKKSLRSAIAHERGIITSAYLVLRCLSTLDAEYLALVLRCWDLKKVFYGYGGGVRQSLTFKEIKKIPVLVPGLSEQKSIVKYAHRIDERVDTLLAKLTGELELLERYRRELIAHAVTRGLDSSVPVRETGIDWVPEGPAHWVKVSAKALFVRRAEFERDGDVHLTPSQAFGVLPQEDFISVSGIKPTLKLSDSGKMKHVERGDFVIHLRSFQGGLEYSEYQGKVSAAYTVITPRDERSIDRGYFRWLFKSTLFIKSLASLTNQLRDGQSINFKTFGKTSYLLPPLDEQQEIARFLNQKTTEIDSIMAGIDTQIELLGRYRKQVINEVVTGKTRIGEVA